ncbi:MAG: DEAD/DEAH box helicase [Desulfobulbaceae bacterium]|uniref:DEAD-box ATP-dependent RNA helicase RhpA n=1 Tax=Candidatus Desulfobia pelagia TaxID=2841692 RepID=A0A8J6TDJ5_9BACT|nr:DEAD/DEAH box helicase [Candidatus Desulfobia pelagia]
MLFSSLGLSEFILRAIDEKGYSTPTPIQVKAIPAVLSGKDVMAAAQTGTGKTAGFTLPLLQRLAGGSKVKANHIRALVLTPTRELAVQVAESVAAYGKYLSLKSGVVYGGVKINPQMMKLRGGVDVLVATPGRLLDLFGQNAVKFSQVETLVLDEADRMLDMGFIGDIRKILALLPKKRQNLLFSATFSSDIRKLADGLLKKPVQIEVGPRNSAVKSVKQWVYEVDKAKKPALLSHLLRNKGWGQVLVFTRTRNGANRLVQQLGQGGIIAAAIHGDKSQGERTRVLADFKASKVRVLVATDVAARGIDINELPHVINFDLPKVPGDYIHRIGRTGRAGSEGEGISLVSADEVKLLSAIETLIRQTLVREVETGFIPTHSVPLTRQVRVGPKKPKKTKQKHREGLETGDEQKSDSSKPRRGGKSQDVKNLKGASRGQGKQRRNSGSASVRKGSALKSTRGVSKKGNRG